MNFKVDKTKEFENDDVEVIQCDNVSGFTVDEKGNLVVQRDSRTMAYFVAGTWTCIYAYADEEDE